VLKELGLSLDEVKRVLDDGISDEENRSLLSAKRTELERQLAQNLQRLHDIEPRLPTARRIRARRSGLLRLSVRHFASDRRRDMHNHSG